MRKICVPESVSKDFKKFIEDSGIALEIAQTGCDLTVKDSGTERLQSDLETLYSGGWISCPNAFALAGKLGVPVAQIGEMLNCLKVKVKNCQLGCF